MILLKAFTKQVGFQAECKQSVGLWWERKSLVVLGSSRLSRLDPSTTRLTGLALRLQRLSMFLRSDSSPGRDRQCLRLNPSGESCLWSVLQVVATGVLEDRWAAGAVDDSVRHTVGLGSEVPS